MGDSFAHYCHSKAIIGITPNAAIVGHHATRGQHTQHLHTFLLNYYRLSATTKFGNSNCVDFVDF